MVLCKREWCRFVVLFFGEDGGVMGGVDEWWSMMLIYRLVFELVGLVKIFYLFLVLFIELV